MIVIGWLLLVAGAFILALFAIASLAARWPAARLDRDDSRTFDERPRVALAALTPNALDDMPSQTPIADSAARYLRLLCIRPATPTQEH